MPFLLDIFGGILHHLLFLISSLGRDMAPILQISIVSSLGYGLTLQEDFVISLLMNIFGG